MMFSTDPNCSFMDDIQLSPLQVLSDFVIPGKLTNEDVPFDFSCDDTNQSPALADERDLIDGFNEAQLQLFNSVDVLVKSSKKPCKSFVVKSFDVNNTANFTNGGSFLQTGQALELTRSPFLYQRARYENELEKIFRSIFVPNSDLITLQASGLHDLRTQLQCFISFWMRITRTTKPYGINNLVLCHPYPIWLNHENAKVYNGSLLVPMKGLIMQVEKLILQKQLQNELKRIERFQVYSTTELGSNEFHSINTSTAKRTIAEYDLQYSVLHFQIIVIDGHGRAYATDLMCQTDPIYEYNATEFKDLPLTIRDYLEHLAECRRAGKGKRSKVNHKKKLAKKHDQG